MEETAHKSRLTPLSSSKSNLQDVWTTVSQFYDLYICAILILSIERAGSSKYGEVSIDPSHLELC